MSKKDSEKPAGVVGSREIVLLGVVVDVVEEALLSVVVDVVEERTKFEDVLFIFDKRMKYDKNTL